MSDERAKDFDVDDFLPEETGSTADACINAPGGIVSAASVPSAQTSAMSHHESWIVAAAKDAMTIEENEIPREMMWARLRQQRERGVVNEDKRRRADRMGAGGMRKLVAGAIAIAATLAIGIGIGRYTQSGSVTTVPSVAATTSKDSATRAALRASDPAVIAMEEHFARTVSLLSTVSRRKSGRWTISWREWLGT